MVLRWGYFLSFNNTSVSRALHNWELLRHTPYKYCIRFRSSLSCHPIFYVQPETTCKGAHRLPSWYTAIMSSCSRPAGSKSWRRTKACINMHTVCSAEIWSCSCKIHLLQLQCIMIAVCLYYHIYLMLWNVLPTHMDFVNLRVELGRSKTKPLPNQ